MIIVREAELKDLEKIIQTHALSAKTAYKNLQSPVTLEQVFSLETLRDNWMCSFLKKQQNPTHVFLLVAEDTEHPEKGIVGVSRCLIVSNPNERSFFDTAMGVHRVDGRLGEIQTLYVHPEFQNKGSNSQTKGVGRALMSEMARCLLAQGVQKSIVITLGGYEASANFYQKIGSARFVGQFTQNAAKVSGAANTEAELTPFNIWLFDNVARCISTPARNVSRRVSLLNPKMKRAGKQLFAFCCLAGVLGLCGIAQVQLGRLELKATLHKMQKVEKDAERSLEEKTKLNRDSSNEQPVKESQENAATKKVTRWTHSLNTFVMTRQRVSSIMEQFRV